MNKRNKNYDGQQLKGVKVAHNADDFQEGQTIILTMRDAPILLGDQLNEEEDILENINMSEHDRFLKAKEAAKKGYDVYAEIEMGDNDNVLKKYDEVDVKKGFRLGGVVTDTATKEEKLSAIRNKLKRMAPNEEKKLEKIQYSLADPYLNPVSEYLPKKATTIKKKRKKSGRSRKYLAEDELAEYKTTENAAIEEEDSREEHRGSREAKQEKTQQMKNLMLQKKQTKAKAYENAIQKAKIQSLNLVDEADLLDDDNEIYAVIAKKKQAAEDMKKFSIKDRVQKSKQIRENEENNKKSVIFTQTSEFCRDLDTLIHSESKSDLIIKAEPGLEDENGNNKNNEMEIEDIKVKEEPSEEKKHVTLIEEPLVSEGLAATLKFLKQTGDPLLMDNGDMFAGRRNDEKLHIDGDPAPDINLEHRDVYGRILTQREVFRILSHKFHGKQPSSNKRAKIQKRYEEEMRLRQMSSSDTPLGTVEKLQREQQRIGEAFIELSGPAVLPSTISDSHSKGFPPLPNKIKQENASGPKRTFAPVPTKEAVTLQPARPAPSTQTVKTGKIEFGFTGTKRNRAEWNK